MNNVNSKFESLLLQPEAVVYKYINALKFEAIFMLLLGGVAILTPLIFSLSLAWLLGSLFLISGLVGFFRTLSTKFLPGRGLSLILYFIFIITGFSVILNPAIGISTIAMIVGIFLVVTGVFKFMLGASVRSGWSIFDGIVNLVLGGLILSNLAQGALLISIFIGIKLIFLGTSMFMLSRQLKTLYKK